MNYKIAVIPGDGIGPEVTAEAVKILDAAASAFGHNFEYEYLLAGGAAIDETERRRKKQDEFNRAHGIVPRTIKKDVRDIIELSPEQDKAGRRKDGVRMTESERREEIAKLEKKMREAAKMLEFEYAAVLRDQLIKLRGEKK